MCTLRMYIHTNMLYATRANVVLLKRSKFYTRFVDIISKLTETIGFILQTMHVYVTYCRLSGFHENVIHK